MNADSGLLLLHVATGAFFATTGARKCFVPDTRAKVFGLFERLGVPVAAGWAVTAGEFAGGLGLLAGCLTQAAAAGLLVIMAGAWRMSAWPGVKSKGLHGSALFAGALCTPEAQLIVVLSALLLSGAGAYSLDALLFG